MTQLPDIHVQPPEEEPEDKDTGVTMTPTSEAPDTGVTMTPVTGRPAVILPPNVVDQRTAKVKEAVGEHLQKTTEQIRAEIAAGKEDYLRRDAAIKMDEGRYNQKINMAIDLANRKGAPLTAEEFQRVTNPFEAPTNPDTVVEKNYGVRFLEPLKTETPNPIVEANKDIPEVVNESFLKGSELTARMEIAKRLKEDQQTRISKQSLVGVAADALKQMWQPYTETQMRGLYSEVGSLAGIDIGSHLQETADRVFAIPDIEVYAKTAKGITDHLAKGNPQLAEQFAEYLEGKSSANRTLDGIFTYMLPLDVAAVGKFGLNVARRISLANRTNKAVKDYVKLADKVGVDASARAEAAGDVGKAAEIKSSDIILRDINAQGDPIKIATDDVLFTSLNQDKDKLLEDVGNLKREQVVRIQDSYIAAGMALLDKIITAARVNRIPMAMATENAVRVVKESIKDSYAGIKNAILDVSNPLYEAKSNTFWHEVTFGNYDGKLFSNPDTAKSFATLHGIDAQIVEGTGRITPKEIEKLQIAKGKIDYNIADWEQTLQRRRNMANDPKLTPSERLSAGENDILRDSIAKAKQKSIELDLRLKGKGSYERATQLEGEIAQMRIVNKNLRKALQTEAREDVKSHMQASVDFGKEQIRLKLQEYKALQEGTASVITAHDTIEQHGIGFKLVVRRPLNETDKAVRDLMIRDTSGKLIPEATSTASQTGFKALFNGALGKFRGADDTLALNDSVNRKIATYTQSLFREWAQEEAKYIKDLASGIVREDPVTGEAIPYWKAKPLSYINRFSKPYTDVKTGDRLTAYSAFSRTLNFARTDIDKVTGEIGSFFKTPGELNDHYLRYYDQSPSFAEHQAYFAFVRMVEGDRILREIAEFRNRARIGAEQFSISARGPDGKQVKSNFFDGVAMNRFPGGDDAMMIMSKKLGEERVVNLGGSEIGPKAIAKYREMVTNGQLKVIRVYAPEHTPLRDFSEVAGNEHVRYILTDQMESKPLEYNHVNRRGGGHFEYDYDHFLKQAKLYHQFESGGKRYKSVYTGDSTFMPLLNRVMGTDIANKLHEVQRLIRGNDLVEAQRYTEAHLPIEWDDLHGMFKPGRDALGKTTPPKLDLHEPFVVVRKGQTVFDVDKGLEERHGLAFKDGAKSGSDNRQFQVAYNTERDSYGLNHFEDIGTQGNPLYKYAPEGKMIDPITTMNRALNRIVNTVYMDDYKIFAVEHWLREAETHLKADKSEIRSSPFWHFQSSNDRSAFKPGTSLETVSNLLSNRMKIQQFIGIPNAADTAIFRAIEVLTDSSYTAFGPTAARSFAAKIATIVPLWTLQHIKDPVTWARSITFHEKLGMFNPAQLLVQAQTFSAILAIAPSHGVTGTYATWLHQMARMNQSPEFLKYLDNMATKLNVFGFSKWKPGEFSEAQRLLKSTGFDTVAGEYANLDTAMKTDYVGNDFKNVMHAGTWFFREGEKSTRLGAWYTAYREFRELKPIGAVTKDDLGKILNRADTLTINMSRASNAGITGQYGGIFSLTTQFLTYQIRMAELFMGNRITPMQKFRLAAFYSALYGAPSAIGLTGLPMANSIREEAIKRGYTPGENFISTAVDVGLPAIFAAWITGKGDLTSTDRWKSGTLPNFGARYGSPGLTQFSDAMKSDAPWYKILTGAAGTTLMNQLTAGSNFWTAAASLLEPNNSKKIYPLMGDDLLDVAKEVSTANQLYKLYTAINYGKWVSKNEGYLGNVSVAGAAFYSVTGTQPQEVEDKYIKGSIRRGEVEFQKHVFKEAVEEYGRYLQAAANHDSEQAKKYYKRVDALMEIGGLPMDKRGTVLAVGAKGFETQINEQDFAFATKNVPTSRKDFLGIPTPFTTQSNIPTTRMEQFTTEKKLQRLRQ